MYLSKKDIIHIIGLCNNKYKNRNNILKLIRDKKVTRLDYMLFQVRFMAKLNEIIASTLNVLKNTNRIVSHREVCEIHDNGEYRISTDEDIEKIDIVNMNVLEALKAKNMFHLHVMNKQDDFYKARNKVLDNLYGWTITIESIEITTRQDLNTSSLAKQLDTSKIQSYINENNSLICNFLDKDARKRYEKQNKDEVFNKDNDVSKYNNDLSDSEAYSKAKHKFYKLPTDYIEKQILLCEELVKLWFISN